MLFTFRQQWPPPPPAAALSLPSPFQRQVPELSWFLATTPPTSSTQWAPGSGGCRASVQRVFPFTCFLAACTVVDPALLEALFLLFLRSRIFSRAPAADLFPVQTHRGRCISSASGPFLHASPIASAVDLEHLGYRLVFTVVFLRSPSIHSAPAQKIPPETNPLRYQSVTTIISPFWPLFPRPCYHLGLSPSPPSTASNLLAHPPPSSQLPATPQLIGTLPFLYFPPPPTAMTPTVLSIKT